MPILDAIPVYPSSLCLNTSLTATSYSEGRDIFDLAVTPAETPQLEESPFGNFQISKLLQNSHISQMAGGQTAFLQGSEKDALQQGPELSINIHFSLLPGCALHS